MNGAIFFSGTYGSTEQYAKWIGEATGLPIFNIKEAHADPSKYGFIVLGSSVLFYKLTIRKWVRVNLSKLNGRSNIIFSVSGAGDSTKLNNWVANSIPSKLLSQMKHVALRGRIDHSKLSLVLRIILWFGSLFNPDPKARKDERRGFDYVSKKSIEPIVKLVEQLACINIHTCL